MSDRSRPTAVDSQLRYRGLRIAMRVQGDGEPLLLINGVTRPLASWEPFTRELTGRTVVTFDVPGVGGSSSPLLPRSIPALADIAVAVLAAAGHARADVLGFSHGGAVAQQLAATKPGSVRRLVLAATSCGVGAQPGNSRAVMRGLAASGGDRSWSGADLLGLLRQSIGFSWWSSIPLLGAISAPTLVVTGRHDRVVPPANSRILAARIRGAKLVMLTAGHDLQQSGPAAALARVVEDHLSAGHAGERLSTSA